MSATVASFESRRFRLTGVANAVVASGGGVIRGGDALLRGEVLSGDFASRGAGGAGISRPEIQTTYRDHSEYPFSTR